MPANLGILVDKIVSILDECPIQQTNSLWEYCFDTQNNWRTHKKVVLPHIIKKVKAKLLKIKNNRIYVCL